MLLSTPKASLGWKAIPFTLPDPDGTSYSLDQLAGEKGLVIAFICNHCPYVQAIGHRLAEDARVLQKDGINMVGINSNDYRSVPDDSPPNMKLLSQKYDFPFPYLVDESQAVGKAYGAVCTPDFFGFNQAGELQYRGRLDDAGMGDASTRTTDMINAMREIAMTGTGPSTQLPSMGCSIKWSR